MNNIEKVYKLIPSISKILLIILFVYAAMSKILDFNNFQAQLGQSPVITAYADWISWFVPLIEIIIASLFLFEKAILFAFYLSYAIMTMFTTYIIIVLNFSDYIPCSCGGVLENLSWSEHILFNLLFIFLSLLSIILLNFRNNTLNVNP